MLQKVFVKIPGVERPYAIIGNFLFEDERYYVLDDQGIRKKIMWSNILYIEDILAFEQEGATPEATPPPSAEKYKEPDELVSVNVFFTGFKEQVFKLPDVPRKALTGKMWSPELAKIIFSNPSIKTFIGGGDLIITKTEVDGENVRIFTSPSQPDRRPMPVEEKVAVAQPQAKIEDVKDKVSAITDIVAKAAASANNTFSPVKFQKPAATVDDFSMPTSPFDSPVSMKVNPKEKRFDEDGNELL